MKIKYKELPLFCPFEIEGKQYIVSAGCAFDGEKIYHIDDEKEVTAHAGVVEFYRNINKPKEPDMYVQEIDHMRELSRYCRSMECEYCAFNSDIREQHCCLLEYTPDKWEAIYDENK